MDAVFAFPVKGTVPVFLLEDKRRGKQLVTTAPYALAETEAFPNPLPESYKGREVYNDRVVYKQYAPHIGYEDLLGYAYSQKPAEGTAVRVLAPQGVLLHESAQDLWMLR